MSFKDYFKNEELSFSDFFEKLKKSNPHVELRKACIEATGMPDVTFWYKLRENKFDEQEKEQIAKVVGRPVKELFPC
ncbi:MAG: hypothetical protein WCX31_04730 [Salinivirgaceae bacterium]|jgi:hypothetical protein